MDRDWEADLRAAGFPERVLAAAVAARESGFFSIAPSEDLLERIVSACRPLLPAPARPHGPDGAGVSSSGVSASSDTDLKERCDARQSEAGMSVRGPK